MNPARFHPQHDWLFIEFKPEKMSKTIIAPNENSALPLGEIISVGPDVKKLRPGQTVMVQLKLCHGVQNKFLFSKESDVYAVVDPESVIQTA